MTIEDGYGAAAMSADVKSPFRAGAKVLSVAIMVLLVIGALGPANWTPRTALGWQTDHFLGYFVITLLVCFAWPRPLAVGGYHGLFVVPERLIWSFRASVMRGA